MYEFVETPTGWKVFWGPMPLEIKQSPVPAKEQAPEVIAYEYLAAIMRADADESLALAV